MKVIACVLLVVGVLSVCFATWGLFTEGGHRRFDEMAVMIPFGAMVLAFIMFGCGGLLFLLASLRQPKITTR